MRPKACCLTDAEMDLGPDGWLGLDDPFSAWRIAEDGQAEELGSDGSPEVD